MPGRSSRAARPGRSVRRSALCAAALVLGALTSACHTYTPVDTARPGTTVRVRVPVISAVANRNQEPRTESVEGVVLASGDTLVLATRRRQEYGAFREIIQHDTLRLAPDQRALVEERAFSTQKSIGLGVALTGLVVGVAVAAFGGDPGSDEGIPPDPPPPPPFAVVSTSTISRVIGLLFGGG